MKNVLRFWVKKGAAGFRVDATDHILEDEQFRDEPLSGVTNDTDSYEYTMKIYTRNLVWKSMTWKRQFVCITLTIDWFSG